LHRNIITRYAELDGPLCAELQVRGQCALPHE
jgi:hypothetical protein